MILPGNQSDDNDQPGDTGTININIYMHTAYKQFESWDMFPVDLLLAPAYDILNVGVDSQMDGWTYMWSSFAENA